MPRAARPSARSRSVAGFTPATAELPSRSVGPDPAMIKTAGPAAAARGTMRDPWSGARPPSMVTSCSVALAPLTTQAAAMPRTTFHPPICLPRQSGPYARPIASQVKAAGAARWQLGGLFLQTA